ncbi:hypothetical protein TRAPUB_8029, partial [Trametes pubescens]
RSPGKKDAKPAASPRKIKAKPSISFKPPAGKPSASPSTLLVKKKSVSAGASPAKFSAAAASKATPPPPSRQNLSAVALPATAPVRRQTVPLRVPITGIAACRTPLTSAPTRTSTATPRSHRHAEVFDDCPGTRSGRFSALSGLVPLLLALQGLLARLLLGLREHLDLRDDSKAVMELQSKAKADFEAIKTETDALEAEQDQALATAEAKIQALEEKNSCIDTRLSEADELKHDNGEKANKVSELAEDLAKAKSAVSAVNQEVESTKAQLEEARALVASLTRTRLSHSSALSPRPGQPLGGPRVAQRDVSRHEGLTRRDGGQLREGARGGRIDARGEATKLRAHQEEVSTLSKEKLQLLTRLFDLRDEFATAKAMGSVWPRHALESNGSTHQCSARVPREDLHRLHEAHNAKTHDLEAEYERAIRTMKEQLEIARIKADVLLQEMAHKMMEQYLEQDQEENQDQITRYHWYINFKDRRNTCGITDNQNQDDG